MQSLKLERHLASKKNLLLPVVLIVLHCFPLNLVIHDSNLKIHE